MGYFSRQQSSENPLGVIYAVVAAVIVYIVCTCVELLRQRLFNAVGTCYGKTGVTEKNRNYVKK